MQPATETPQRSSERRAIPGRRFVLLFFAAGATVAGLIVLLTVLVVREPGDADPACQEESQVCKAVQDYVDDVNGRASELERVEDLHITSVSVRDGSAVVRVRFTQADQPADATFRLVRDGGSPMEGNWRIEEGPPWP